ncbi:MAG: hypothetical protein KIS76_11565 [Pyrinomonadaceae bacterium]|nr:hypothetical protein [Pyrinomonadaceae bacterium]
MTRDKFKVIVLTHGNPRLLLDGLLKIEEIEVAGVFVETRTQPERPFVEKLKRSVKYDGYGATFKKFAAKIVGSETEGGEALNAVAENQNALKSFAEKKGITLETVESYHSDDAKELIRSVGADLGILYGTNIIKKDVFSIPRLGSINVHQGLAPLYRGGPSVFWELFNGEKEVGVTVHFVAPKVDTGDVILQKSFPLEYDFDKYDLDYERFMEDFRENLQVPMAEMICESVRLIAAGNEPRIKQDLSLGKRYRLPVKAEKDAMLRILRKRRRI